MVLALACAAAVAGLDFMVMGDWGGIPLSPFYTPGEKNVAKDLGARVGKTNASFTLALGDNFYLTGVKDVHDARFNETFESVFDSPNLRAPRHFRVIAGNHDHYGNVSAQIAYSAVSPRWHFPSLWYDFTEVGSDGTTAQFVMLDTVTLSGNTPMDEEDFSGARMPGAQDAALAEEQWAWINATLHASTADYLLVAGHFPIYSVCEHGPTAGLADRLLPLLKSSGAAAYLAGHDHCDEFLLDEGVAHHGIGASHCAFGKISHKADVPDGSLKWLWDAGPGGLLKGAYAHFTADKDGLVGRHYAADGTLLFTAPPQAPRKRK